MSPKKNLDLPSNRKFGLFFASIFGISFLYLMWKSSSVLGYFSLFISFCFLIFSLVSPHSLLPLNKLWMGIGVFLGNIVSPVVLSLIFFILFTPIGIIMRMFGRDELRLKPLKSDSYWKIRPQDCENSGEHFKNQF
jgi:hypothetical protein